MLETDTSNLGNFFYRAYFKGLQWPPANESDEAKKERKKENKSILDDRNKAIIGLTFTEKSNDFLYKHLDKQKANTFRLETTYPGLLIGIGLEHEAGQEGEIKLGFYLDYTSGLPMIPGSSVKGVLRSVFPGQTRQLANKRKEGEDLVKKVEVMEEYLLSLFNEINEELNNELSLTEEEIAFLELEIFGPITVESKRSADNLPIIFHDAMLFSNSNVKISGEDSKRFLGLDFITPHNDPLKDPNPLQFLKILPGVIFLFQFELHDIRISEEKVVPATYINLLFKKILLDIGIGAKTNVGYGQFIDVNF